MRIVLTLFFIVLFLSGHIRHSSQDGQHKATRRSHRSVLWSHGGKQIVLMSLNKRGTGLTLYVSYFWGTENKCSMWFWKEISLLSSTIWSIARLSSFLFFFIFWSFRWDARTRALMVWLYTSIFLYYCCSILYPGHQMRFRRCSVFTWQQPMNFSKSFNTLAKIREK